MSLLSDRAILRHMDQGTIVISPFVKENLSTSSYDVTLGENYFREQRTVGRIYNPYDKEEVERVWGVAKKAKSVSDWKKRNNANSLKNIPDDALVIWIKPNETILCHTKEYLGGKKTVSTMMKARSSMGRNFLEVCKCAGWGDIGYVNRWTMEITNNSQYYSIPLVVGRRIGQIVFFETEGTDRSYENEGKYQLSSDIEALSKTWSALDMLPKLYKDREAEACTNSNFTIESEEEEEMKV